MKTIWIGIIVIIFLAVIGISGYMIHAHIKNPIQNPTPPIAASHMMRTQPTIMVSTNVYQIMPSGKLGPIFTDTKGMTLYTFKNDAPGVSHCLAGCLKAWPAYVASSQKNNLPTNITIIKRSDGVLQYAWKNMPLYYFVHDKNPGDVNGEGIGGVWSVVKQQS